MVQDNQEQGGLPTIYFVRRWIDFLTPVLFLVGIFLRIEPIWFFSGIVLIINDLLAILVGELNPIFPIFSAIIAAIFINPWYLGVFWASEIFSVLSVPTSFLLIFSKKARQADEENHEKERWMSSLK